MAPTLIKLIYSPKYGSSLSSMRLPGFALINLSHARLKELLSGLKNERSRGCKKCVVWLGGHNSIISFAWAFSSISHEFICEPCPSKIRRHFPVGFLGIKLFVNQSIDSLPFLCELITSQQALGVLILFLM